MTIRIDEIGDRNYRISVHVPEIAPPDGFTYNAFLIDGDEPMLFHTGLRQMFGGIREALVRVMPAKRLRWISFGHYEADECGSMNEWLKVAPQAEVAHGQIGAMVSLQDMADRPPRVLADGEMLDIGGKRIRYIDTHHVPHGWDAGVIFEEQSGTLFCGDLFTQIGNGAAVTPKDIVEPAIVAEKMFDYTSLGPATAPNIRKLAALAPKKLALMHGPTFEGDCAGALNDLADFYEERLRAALPADFMARAAA
jgi:flavorubredoxin